MERLGFIWSDSVLFGATRDSARLGVVSDGDSATRPTLRFVLERRTCLARVVLVCLARTGHAADSLCGAHPGSRPRRTRAPRLTIWRVPTAVTPRGGSGGQRARGYSVWASPAGGAVRARPRWRLPALLLARPAPGRALPVTTIPPQGAKAWTGRNCRQFGVKARALSRAQRGGRARCEAPEGLGSGLAFGRPTRRAGAV